MENVIYTVRCPICNVIYNVDKLQDKNVRCLDCGCTYNQKTQALIQDSFTKQLVMGSWKL